MRWRLGVDLGSGSLGWCVLVLDDDGRPCKIEALGSRIFGDGREPARGDGQGKPLALARRQARAARRRRDRFKRRQAALLRHLTRDGLFPADIEAAKALEALDPFALRAQALSEALPLHHLGRALFHLGQRRGFQSNRKAGPDDDEQGKIACGIDRLRAAMAATGAPTLGAFLHQRRQQGLDANTIPSVRARLRPEPGAPSQKETGYDFYPGRALIAEEFDAILAEQARHHPAVLTEEVCRRLHEIVFHQRPLASPKVGLCTLVAGEQRLPKAHPLFQRRRLLELVNGLRIARRGESATALTLAQRDLVLARLKDRKKVAVASLIKALKLPDDVGLNHEDDLAGDELAAELANKKRFGPRWLALPLERQWQIIERLRDDQDEAQLLAWLESDCQLTPDQALATARARLPEGYGRFGLTATKRLVEVMQAQVVVYSEAVRLAGLGHHSDLRTGEVFDALPYYGVPLERHLLPGSGEPGDAEETRIGRLTNPTVHVGLNQLRRLVNRLIRRFGRPAEIVVEIGRDLKQGEEEKLRRARENKLNRVEAERRSAKLATLSQPDSGANRARLKLWEELNPENVMDRRCVYSGERISAEMLFSDAVEIDHILPFSATLDDSNANKILCLRSANRAKAKRSPYDAWGHTGAWPDIAERAAHLPKEKRWRFDADAMTRLEERGGFLARHLVDTQYLSRLAREYLAALYPETGEGSQHVWVSPGRLTEMVRRKLALNELLPDHNFGAGADQPKNRLDHRHHAIDAVVVAVIDRGLLQEMARASAREGDAGRERVIVPAPWPSFRDDLRTALATITVSHRCDHGTTAKGGLRRGQDQTAGRLHNDTAYGLTSERNDNAIPLVVHRVGLGTLEKAADIAQIRDPALRDLLTQATAGLKDKDKTFLAAVAAFAATAPAPFRGIRRVRVIEPLNLIVIRDRRTGLAYKGYKGDSNHRLDVWELPDGSWTWEIISTYQAHQPGQISPIRAENPTARKVLSLQRDDMVAVERVAGDRELLRVVKFSEKQLALAAPQEGGRLKARSEDKDDPFRYLYPSASTLKAWRARQVRIDELGRVMDPGFPARKSRRLTRPRGGS